MKAFCVLLFVCLAAGHELKTSQELELGGLRVRVARIELIVSRLAQAVVESSQRKAPCVCGGRCTSNMQVAQESECQTCQRFMAWILEAQQKIVAPNENAAYYPTFVKALQGMNTESLNMLTNFGLSTACAKAESELNTMDDETSKLPTELRHLLPDQNARRQQTQRAVELCDEQGGWSVVVCEGALLHLELAQALHPVMVPDVDGGRMLTALTKTFLKSIFKGTSGTPTNRAREAARKLGIAPFVKARTAFNSLLCEFAGLKRCIIAEPAFITDAGHRKETILGPLYRELVHTLQSVGYSAVKPRDLEVTTQVVKHTPKRWTKAMHELELTRLGTVVCLVASAYSALNDANEAIKDFTDGEVGVFDVADRLVNGAESE